MALAVRKLQGVIVDALENVKAQDIRVFDTEHLSALFERVIVASGTSNRQTRALASSVRDAVKAAGEPNPRTEGEENGEWIIVDCGPAVVHVMQPAIRTYYHLEELWGEKPVVSKATAKKAAVGARTAARTASAARAAPPAAPAKSARKTAAKSATRSAAKPDGRPSAETFAKGPERTASAGAARPAAKKAASRPVRKSPAGPAAKAASRPAAKAAPRSAASPGARKSASPRPAAKRPAPTSRSR